MSSVCCVRAIWRKRVNHKSRLIILFNMLKVVQELKKRPEVSQDDFQGFVLKNYAKFLRKLPGLRSALAKFIQGGYQLEVLPVDCCIEMEFRSEEAFKKAIESEEAKKVLEELSRVAEKTVFLYLKERGIKKVQAKPLKKKKKAKR